REAGCDGRFGRKTCGPVRTVKPCGSGSPMLESSFRNHFRRRWWLTSPAHQEEHGAAVKPLRRECRSDFGVPVLACVRLLRFARKAVGAACTRHFLRPQFFPRDTDNAKPGRIAPRECGWLFEIQISKAPRIRIASPRLRGEVEDHIASPTSAGGLAVADGLTIECVAQAPFQILNGHGRLVAARSSVHSKVRDSNPREVVLESTYTQGDSHDLAPNRAPGGSVDRFVVAYRCVVF